MNINCIVHCRMRHKRFLQLMGTFKSIEQSTGIDILLNKVRPKLVAFIYTCNKELTST